MTVKTETKVSKSPAKASKASGNTPAKTKTAKPKAAPAKVEQKAKAPHIFALVAGMVVKLDNKYLKQAVSYHVKKGNLCKVNEGIRLTAQGASLWNAERIKTDPAKFQEIAAFVHKVGPVPANTRWQTGGNPATITDKLQFPPMIHWGGFAQDIMRQAFAALWAK